jgi:ABC-type enterochelin transport system permease subunit
MPSIYVLCLVAIALGVFFRGLAAFLEVFRPRR